MAADWIDDLCGRLGCLSDEPALREAELAAIEASAPVVARFLLDNRAMLARVGREGFRDFLMLWRMGQAEEAFRIMFEAMGPDEIVRRMHANVEELKRINDDWDEFCGKCGQLLLALAPVALKILLALLVA